MVDQNKIIFSMIGVNKTIDKRDIIKDISLSYFYGAKIGVIGLNGSGKSTLLRIMAGIDTDYNGEVHSSQEYSIGYLEQEPQLDEDKTVKEIVEEGAGEAATLMREYEEINERFGQEMSDEEMNALIERQGEVQEKIDAMDAWDIDSKLEMAMDALRCPPPDTLTKIISGGEKRRVALCRLLLQNPDVLLLDEPTNHLDAESVGWLEQHLRQYKGTVIAITHDRYFLDNVAGWILELDRGEGVPWKGNYSSWLEQKQTRLKTEEKQASERQKTLQRELEWIRMTPKARQSKSKARITAYQNLAENSGKAQSKGLELFIPAGPRLGTKVIEINGVSKSFEKKLLLDNVSLVIPAGAIVGIIGPNGAGKTTLFKMITGEEQPDSGKIVLGDTVVLGYAEQNRIALQSDKTVWETISSGQDQIQLGNQLINSRAFVSKFNFVGTNQQKNISSLSGGERNRVNLALMVRSNANVLLLDEPTNDLDVNTIRALEDAITSFAGCVLTVSHDRWFLDRIATHILAFEGDSKLTFFEGNFQDYEQDLKARLGNKAGQPHRIKYRQLTR